MRDKHRDKQPSDKISGESGTGVHDDSSPDGALETLALLKILDLGAAQVGAGRVKPAREIIARLRAKPFPTG